MNGLYVSVKFVQSVVVNRHDHVLGEGVAPLPLSEDEPLIWSYSLSVATPPGWQWHLLAADTSTRSS